MAFFDQGGGYGQSQQPNDIYGYNYRSPLYSGYGDSMAYSGFNNPVTSGGSFGRPASTMPDINKLLQMIGVPSGQGMDLQQLMGQQQGQTGDMAQSGTLSPEIAKPPDFGPDFAAFLNFMQQLGPMLYGQR